MFGIHRRDPSSIAWLPALCATAWLAGCSDGPAETADAAADAAGEFDAMPDGATRPDAILADAWVPPIGATCYDPFVLAPGASHDSDTTDLLNDLSGSCSAGSGVAPDAVYLVDMGEVPRDLTVVVTVDEDAETPFDVVLYARTDCLNPATSVACADVGWGERLELLSVSGPVTLVVDGTDQYGAARQGAYSLATSARDLATSGSACDPSAITSRCESGQRCVSSICVAEDAALACSLAVADPTDVVASTHAFEADFHAGSCAYDPEGSFPEHLYRLELGVTSDLLATTDFAETDFDTYLYLRSATCDGDEVGCHDDVDVEGHNLRSTLSITGLPPGTYYLFVDGSSASPGTGTYRLQVAVTPST